MINSQNGPEKNYIHNLSEIKIAEILDQASICYGTWNFNWITEPIENLKFYPEEKHSHTTFCLSFLRAHRFFEACPKSPWTTGKSTSVSRREHSSGSEGRPIQYNHYGKTTKGLEVAKSTRSLSFLILLDLWIVFSSKFLVAASLLQSLFVHYLPLKAGAWNSTRHFFMILLHLLSMDELIKIYEG